MKSFITILALVFFMSLPAGAQVTWTKAQMDSVQKMLTSIPNDSTVSMKTLRLAMAYAYLKTLADGHKQYVSMPGYARSGVAVQMKARADSLDRHNHLLRVDFNQLSASVGQEMENQFNEVRNTLDEHEGRINRHDELEAARADDEDDIADAAIEKIRVDYAKRILAKEQEKLKESQAVERTEADKTKQLRRIRVGVKR